MSVKCTICHRELPESAFYVKRLRRYQYQCKECIQKQNKAYKEEVEGYILKDFDRNYGGYTLYILNYPNPFRYIIKGTNGMFFKTNDSSEFMKEVNIIVDSCAR